MIQKLKSTSRFITETKILGTDGPVRRPRMNEVVNYALFQQRRLELGMLVLCYEEHPLKIEENTGYRYISTMKGIEYLSPIMIESSKRNKVFEGWTLINDRGSLIIYHQETETKLDILNFESEWGKYSIEEFQNKFNLLEVSQDSLINIISYNTHKQLTV